MTLRSLALKLVVGLTALGLGCDLIGGDSSPSFKDDVADRVAAAALPDASELGSGWAIVERDNLSRESLATIAPCQPLLTQQQEADAALPSRTGRARVTLEHSDPRPGWVFSQQLTVTADIFPSDDAAEAYVSSAKRTWDSGAIAPCLGGLYSAALPEGSKVLSGVRGARTRLEGWASNATELTVTTSGERVELRVELYASRLGNAAIQVTASGQASAVSETMLFPLLDSLGRGLQTLARDPASSPHDPFVLQAEATTGGTLDAAYLPDNVMVPIDAYAQSFCEAVSAWTKTRAQVTKPVRGDSVSDYRAEQSAYYNALRDGMEAYVQRVIAAGYPDMDNGWGFAGSLIKALLRAKGQFEQASDRTEAIPDSWEAFDNMNAQLELDLEAGSLDIVKDFVRISRDYDLAGFMDAVAATPGCEAPWEESDPSGTL